jgi:hypothetical protein
MVRFGVLLFIGLLLLPDRCLRAADNPVAGTWKMPVIIQTNKGPVQVMFLLLFKESDKGWAGEVLGYTQNLPNEPTFEKVAVKEDHVQFSIKVGADQLTFDGRIQKDAKKILGTFEFLGQLLLTEVVPSKLKNLTDEYALARENLDTMEGGQPYFSSLNLVLKKAAAKKLKPEEVRDLADKGAKVAEKYGPRWQRTILLRMASTLAGEEGYAAVAIEQVRQAERMLKPDDDMATHMQVLEALASVLRKANKTDELKTVETRILKMESRDYADFVKANPIKAEEFKGRKAKSDRAVLVELFTQIDMDGCATLQLACDALMNSFKPTEVIVLEYHVPFDNYDGLTSRDLINRFRNYKDRQPGPSVYINGKKDETGTGPRTSAKLKYTAYRETIEELLEKPAPLKLQLTASQKGKEISIKANISELKKPGENVILRFALVEDRIRYGGENGIRYQHAVVRSFPGGLKGFPLTKAEAEEKVTVNVDSVREDLIKQLDELTRGDPELAQLPRPMALKNLRVVAFVQDDTTNEILQAVQVEVEEKKE